jgi:hypothetical protein
MTEPFLAAPDPTTPADTLSAYCMECSAAPGTPCNNPFTGQDVPPHRSRMKLSALQAWDNWRLS